MAPRRRRTIPHVEQRAAAAWHAMSPADALRALDSQRTGLSETEARDRVARIGRNVLIATPPEAAWRVLVRQLRSVVVALLGVATILAWLTGEHLDAAAIGCVLVLNVAIGFATELRARRAMEALLRLDVAHAVVVRDGIARPVDAAELVPGDVIRLDAGIAVPADARLLDSAELVAIESALTGESEPVSKHADAMLDHGVVLPDRTTMVYKGAAIAGGAGHAVVVATGMATEVGRIGTLVRSIREEPTVLERRLDALGRRLAVVAVVVAAIVALLAFFRGTPLGDVLQVGIAVAIAAVPEGLPAVVTITMAVAMRRMSQRRALVRRMPAVETLGSVTVICTDKTGTLTAGEQTLTSIWVPDEEIAVTESSVFGARAAEVERGLAAGAVSERVHDALVVGTLANGAELLEDASGTRGYGDPTEVALLVAAARAGIRRAEVLEGWPEVGQLPFSSARMLMATFHRSADGELWAFVKGAPGRVLPVCDTLAALAGEAPETDETWRTVVGERATAMASRGLRVLALAAGPIAAPTAGALRGLRLVGLFGCTDPIAPGAAETVGALRGAGIRTVMLTGDHRATAEAVARGVGLLDGARETLEGATLDAMPDEVLQARVRQVGIASRISPEGKLRFVAALQREGDIVAMIGDGINDTAALRKADIGVAMGQRGTDAAKEVAGIVLADDRLQTIAAAVEQGRVVFDNIRKFVFYLFSCNLAEILTLLGAGAASLPLPMTALQILWMNLVTDTFPALALALEPAEAAMMRRPPRDPEAALLSGRLVRLTIAYGLLIAAVTLAALVWGLHEWPDAPARATTLSFTTLALAQLFHLGNARSREHVATAPRALANRYAVGAVLLMIAAQVLAVVPGPLARVLGTAPLTMKGWVVALALSVTPGIVGQATKLLAAERGGRPR